MTKKNSRSKPAIKTECFKSSVLSKYWNSLKADEKGEVDQKTILQVFLHYVSSQ